MHFAAANYRQLVAAPNDLYVQGILNLGEISIKLSAKVDQNAVVGKFQKYLVNIIR